VLASVYAIEALKIFDHFSFRDKMMTATTAQPLILWYPGKADAAQPWWTPAYDQNDIKYRDRCLFAAIPLAATLQSHKDVDWSSIGSPAPGAGPKKSKPASGGSGKKKGPAKASKVPEKKTKPAAKKTKPAAKKKPPRKGAVKKKGPAKKATAKKAAKKVAKKGAAKRPAAKRSPAKKASKRAPAKKAKKGRGK
jgi:hypothetical protein